MSGGDVISGIVIFWYAVGGFVALGLLVGFIAWFLKICGKLYRHEWLVEPVPKDYQAGDLLVNSEDKEDQALYEKYYGKERRARRVP